MSRTKKEFEGIRDFYPYYLSQHQNPRNRALHFVGTSLLLILAVSIGWTKSWQFLPLLPLCGYGFAWCGHFFVERNKPATFTYPLLSFVCDFLMYFDILRMRITLFEPANDLNG